MGETAGISTAMRRAVANLIAVFTVIVLAFAFGGCACAYDDGADGCSDGVSVCIVSCACHGASLTFESSLPVVPCQDRQAYRPGDEQLILPLAIADIFNPPKV